MIGITATHALPFENKPPTHAKFDRNEVANHWAISSRTLRELVDHFGPKIELLDISTDGGSVVNFACFSEKQYVKTEGEGLKSTLTPLYLPELDFLNKPLHTSIAVEVDEFDRFEVEDKLHIIISVKDFKAILHHCGLTSGELTAAYSNPGRPMKLSYSSDGILCEFILMTVGEKGTGVQKTKKGRSKSVRAAQPALDANAQRTASEAAQPEQSQQSNRVQQPEPVRPRPSTQRHPLFEMRPPPLPPPSTFQSESMFMPQDDDRQWEPMNQDEEDDEMENARLEWDASNQEVCRVSFLLLQPMLTPYSQTRHCA